MRDIAVLSSKSGSPYIVSDEIYHGLVYEGKEHSIFEFTDNAFVVKIHAHWMLLAFFSQYFGLETS